MNDKWREDALSYLNEYRYTNKNYYLSDEAMADFALEYLVKTLRARLSTCLNVSEGYCDIWYKDSHSECLSLMESLRDITGISVMKNNDPIMNLLPSQLEYNTDEVW